MRVFQVRGPSWRWPHRATPHSLACERLVSTPAQPRLRVPPREPVTPWASAPPLLMGELGLGISECPARSATLTLAGIYHHCAVITCLKNTSSMDCGHPSVLPRSHWNERQMDLRDAGPALDHTAPRTMPRPPGEPRRTPDSLRHETHTQSEEELPRTSCWNAYTCSLVTQLQHLFNHL